MVDQQGAAVPAADITLTDRSTGIPMKTATNADGRFFYSTVPNGNYNVSFVKTGFETFKVDNQRAATSARC